jgi:hypothetical protein
MNPDAEFRDAVRAHTQVIAESLVISRDNLMRDAVSRFIGASDWELEAILGRGHLYKLPDGSEIFSFDGVELLKFRPLETKTTIDRNGAVHVTAEQPYEILR